MEKNGDTNSHSSASEKQLQNAEIQVTSENLPRDVCMQLYNLMKQVVCDDINPKTVNAACGCASEIHKILKLNKEMQ